MRPRSLAQATMESGLIVRLYESRLWRRNPLLAVLMGLTFEKEYALIAQAARLTASDIILDLACGPATYARRLAREVRRGRVVGLDMSLPMLRYGQRVVDRDNFSNVTLLQGNAMALPFLAGHFNVVNCCGALHLFADVAGVLREIGRVLKVGGRFTIATYRKRGGRLSEQVVRLRRGLFGMNAFRPDEMMGELQAAGFDRVECHHAKGIWLIMSATKAR